MRNYPVGHQYGANDSKSYGLHMWAYIRTEWGQGARGGEGHQHPKS